MQYETELGGLRPLISRVENYELELKNLRLQLEYHAYPSNTFRDNPLPQPPIPAPYESQRASLTSKSRLSSSTSSYPKPSTDTKDGNHYTNIYTMDPASDSNISKRNLKGKEREHGPSYNLSAPSSNYDPSAEPPHASYANHSLASTSDGVLPGASPRRRVVPTTNSKPNLPDPEPKIEPKLVSGARPDLPVPQTPEISSPLSGGMLDPPVPGREFPDVYSFGDAYVSEYAAGLRAGYQLAEYTPGQAAMVVPSQNTGAMNVAGNPYGNGFNANGERRETARGLTDMNALSMALSEVLSTPSMHSNEISRDGNSQVGVWDIASTTTAGDSVSSTSNSSRRTPRRHSVSYHSPAQSQQTRATGQLTDNATLSSFSTGTTDGSASLSKRSSLRQQPTFRGNEGSSALFSGLGFTAATNHTGNSGAGTRPQYLPHASMPPPSLGVGIITTVPPTTTQATADQAAMAVTRDDRSGRSNFSGSSWGTINTHSISLRSWQSNGSHMMGFPLRTFASHAGAGSAPVDDNWGPSNLLMTVDPPTTTTVDSTAGNERNGSDHARDDDGGFRVVRESDEERTPMSRFSRTLPAASEAPIATGGEGGERSQVASENRDREVNREQERSDRRRDRRRSQAYSIAPSHTNNAAGYAQPIEYPTEQSRSLELYSAPASYPNSSSLLLQPANTTSSHSRHPSQGQSQPQTEDRRLRRRLSTVTAPVESQHTNIVFTQAPAHASSEWGADPGYYTDVPSASSNHRYYTASHYQQESRNNNVPATGDAAGNNLITSPTLFSSNASTNALGLDGLDEQQRRPLPISAPTPIVSSRSFLRSYSYDHF